MKWRPLSRRAFLGGAGTIISLPFLESIGPRARFARRAHAATGPQRLMFFFAPNGYIADSFFPSGTGSNFTLGATLKDLEPHKSKLIFPMGLNNDIIKPEGGGNHAPGVSGILTCAKIPRVSGADIRCGQSIDQKIADKVGMMTRNRSLHWGMEPAKPMPGDCDFGFSCLYLNSISWVSETQQNPHVLNPKNAFASLFEGLDKGETSIEEKRRLEDRKSVLDYATAEAEDLKNRLSASDKTRLDRYLTSVRELERRLDTIIDTSGGGAGATQCNVPATFENGRGIDGQIEAMQDIAILAFECDITRVQTLMTGIGFSNRPYSFLGVGNNGNSEVQHHILSHHNNVAAAVSDLRRIDAWTGKWYARLVDELAKRDEGGSSLLDSAAVVMCSDVQDGNRHSYTDNRIAIAGSLGGKLKTGQALQVDTNTPLANLWATFMRAYDISGSFANSNGVIDPILA